MRLTRTGREIGLVDDERWNAFQDKVTSYQTEIARLNKEKLKPLADTQEKLGAMGFGPIKDALTGIEFLKRPEVKYADVIRFVGESSEKLDRTVIELIETEVTYEGYIKKAKEQVEKMHRLEAKRIPKNMNWDALDSIATEARQKFKKINPETLGQASRISGVNPADISILMVYLEGKR